MAGDDRGWAPIEETPSGPSGTWAPPTQPPQSPPTWGPPTPPKAGDAGTGPLPLHPMSVGDILDGAFKLFKANARTLVIIVAAITVPLQLLTSFVLRESFSPGILNILRDPTLVEAQSENSSLGQFGTSIFAALLGMVVTPFIAGAVSRVVAASYLGQRVEAGEALRSALRRFPALLGAFVLVHVVEGVGVLLCLVPGLLVMPMFVAVAPAIAIEQIGPIAAITRSWRLVRPRYGPILGICLLTALISSMLANLIAFAPTTIALVFGGSFAWLLVAVGSVGAELVAAPIVVIVSTLVYFDARIRWEGFDLQLMAVDLERGARH